jgi:hypothetical protein
MQEPNRDFIADRQQQILGYEVRLGQYGQLEMERRDGADR